MKQLDYKNVVDRDVKWKNNKAVVTTTKTITIINEMDKRDVRHHIKDINDAFKRIEGQRKESENAEKLRKGEEAQLRKILSDNKKMLDNWGK